MASTKHDRPAANPTIPQPSGSSWQVAVICGGLLLAVGLVFGGTLRDEFVNYDDNSYVYDNPHVARGLTAEGMAWAFTTRHASNWHPLTWLSHMLDCQLYGLSPGGHHLTSVLLHGVTVVLLFLALRQMTGALWRSAFAAALFAIHPLRVESVAWISERKDVLSGLFFMLTLLAYVAYVRRPFSLSRYLVVIAFFALGLMAKPMLVTVPFVLLLLDYWPLGRLTAHGAKPDASSWPMHPVLEKIPLLVLAAVSCALTLWSQSRVIESYTEVPFLMRTANAAVSYVAYLAKLFYPENLVVLYPYTVSVLPAWKIGGSVLVLLALSGIAFAWRRRHPHFLTGWLWYLGMLVPVIGLVQVGMQTMADRYTYLPQIGLGIALAWGATEVGRFRSFGLGVCRFAAVSVLLVLMGCAWRQTWFWRDSETLWSHMLECTAHGQPGDKRSVSLFDSGYAEAHCNLGAALVNRGRLPEGMAQLEQALALKPDFARARYNLAVACVSLGQWEQAVAHLREALKLDPGNAEAHNNLGVALINLGRVDEAFAHFQQAVEINPEYAEAQNNLGNGLVSRGRLDEAIRHFRKALELKPGYAEAQNSLAWQLATAPNAPQRNGPEAVDLASRANRFYGGKQPDILGTLAAAFAEAGRFPEALAAAQDALDLARQQDDPVLVNALRDQIALYQAGKPFHQAPASSENPVQP